jgi:RNA polymerase sigma factor (sigma-70 family)
MAIHHLKARPRKKCVSARIALPIVDGWIVLASSNNCSEARPAWMIDDDDLNAWFVREVLPLERALSSYLHRNWRVPEDVLELRQDIYENVLISARRTLPTNTRAYIYTVARNHLINHAKRARIVPIEAIADLDSVHGDMDFGMFEAERTLSARDELRRTKEGIDKLPAKCREVILLQKVDGMTDREAAEHLGVGIETVRRQIKLGMKALFDHMAGGSGRIVRKNYRRRSDHEALP